MIKESQRPPRTVRNISPCKDCTEKYKACHDNCPKDSRGEVGYKTWKTEIDSIKAEREKYLQFSKPKWKLAAWYRKENNNG